MSKHNLVKLHTGSGIASRPVQITSLITRPAPEFFPLPQKGLDPYFSLSRSSYYDLEYRGLLKLARLRKPGNLRGKVLVPYSATGDLIRRLAKQGGRV